MPVQPPPSPWTLVLAQLRVLQDLISAGETSLKGGSPEVRAELGGILRSMGESFIRCGEHLEREGQG